MAYEQRDNTGSLFKNLDKEEGSNKPDYSGTCMVGGVEHYFDSWVKVADSGRKWLSFSFKPKQKQAPAPAPSQQRAPSRPAKHGLDDMDDDIPF